MKFKKFYFKEDTSTTTADIAVHAKKIGKDLEEFGYTSEDNDHKHKVFVDKNGNGQTSNDKDHVHHIQNWKVQEANDHFHTIEK